MTNPPPNPETTQSSDDRLLENHMILVDLQREEIRRLTLTHEELAQEVQEIEAREKRTRMRFNALRHVHVLNDILHRDLTSGEIRDERLPDYLSEVERAIQDLREQFRGNRIRTRPIGPEEGQVWPVGQLNTGTPVGQSHPAYHGPNQGRD